METMLARTTTLQTTLLQSVDDPGRKILVGNTHLYFKPDADHIRDPFQSIIYKQDNYFILSDIEVSSYQTL